MAAEKDPWTRSLLSPSPVPSYFSDTEDLPRDGAFITLAAESDLANELDLSRRDDRAIVTKTPFTLATLRAKKTGAGKTRSKSEESNRVGNIKIAEDALKPSKPTPDKPAKPAPKKDAWKHSTGWSDPSGQAILPTNKPKKKAADTGGKGGKGKGKKAAAAEESSVASSSKTKGKAIGDKIQFRRLPADLAPTADFPIVAGFERQKALPKKAPKPPAAKAKPKVQQTKLNFSSRAPVDVNALVVGLNGGAARLKPSAKKPIRVYSSSSDGSSSSALSIRKAISSLPFDDEDGLRAPSTLTRTQQTPPLTRSDWTPSPEEPHPIPDPTTPAPRVRRDPTASKAPDIALLEAMAEKGDMGPKSGSMFSQLMPSRPEVSYDRRSYYASAALPPPSKVTEYYSVRSADATIPSAQPPVSPVPDYGREHSSSLIRPDPRSSQTSSRYLPRAPLASFALDYRGPPSDPQRPEEQYLASSPQAPSFPDQSRTFAPSPSFLDHRPVAVPSQPFSGQRMEQAPFRSMEQTPFPSMEQAPFRSMGQAPSRSVRVPQVSSSAYGTRQKRTRSTWQSMLEGPPSSSADGEWGTLHNKKSRLTLRPSTSSTPKVSGSFQMPLFDRPQVKPSLSRQRTQPASPAPADINSQLATRTQVTVWAPPPSKLQLQQYSAPVASQGYVPAPLKALQGAPALDGQLWPLTPTYSGPSRSAPSRTRMVPPTRPPVEEEEDWAAAWTQSVNRASRHASS